MGTILTPILCATAGTSKAYNPGIAETYSWLPIEGEALGRPLYARASYITNFSDMAINLSASEVSIGAVTLKDNNSGLNADVVSVPGYGAGLQVLTQDLESSIDDITIGDKNGNYASVDPVLSALNVKIVNSNAVSISGNITVSNTVGVSATNLQNIENLLLQTTSLLSTLTSTSNRINGFIIPDYNTIKNYYYTTTTNIEKVEYKQNSTVVATLSFTYVDPLTSSNPRLDEVIKL